MIAHKTFNEFDIGSFGQGSPIFQLMTIFLNTSLLFKFARFVWGLGSFCFSRGRYCLKIRDRLQKVAFFHVC